MFGATPPLIKVDGLEANSIWHDEGKGEIAADKRG
jgi:hypothetical protein